MTTLVGVGRSDHRRSEDAGRLAGRQALHDLAPDNHGDICLCLVFTTTGYLPDRLLLGVREVVGDVPMVGCSAEGIITTRSSDEGSHAVVVWLLAMPGVEATVALVEGADVDPARAGAGLADQLRLEPDDTGLILLFPDGLTVDCTAVLRSLQHRLPKAMSVAGGTASDMMRFHRTWQFANWQIYEDAIAAVALRGNLRVSVATGHGCEPVSREMVVTSAHGATVVSIDGEPACDVFKAYLDNPEDVTTADFVHLSLGQVVEGAGEPFWVIRTPLQVETDNGSLTFGAEVVEGSRVRVFSRSPTRVAESARSTVAKLCSEPDRLVAVLHFDCAGRGRSFFGMRVIEMAIDPIHGRLNDDVVVAGFHTFGEIARVSREVLYNNYTVVLVGIFAGD